MLSVLVFTLTLGLIVLLMYTLFINFPLKPSGLDDTKASKAAVAFSVSWSIEKDLLPTTTANAPVLSILNSTRPALTAVIASAVTAGEIINLVHSVDSSYRFGKAAFLTKDSTLAAVRELKDGDRNYLWQIGNYQAGVPQNLLG